MATQKPFVVYVDMDALQDAHLRAAERVRAQGPFATFRNGTEGRTNAYHTLKETTDQMIALQKEGVAKIADASTMPPSNRAIESDKAPPADLG